MELSNEQITKYTKRIMRSRMRLLCNYGFYGLLLMHIIFTIDIKTDTIWTDGIRIGLNPSFLDELSDDELDYVFMHEILHIALDHGKRRCNFDEKKYDIAADIVVNSIIFSSSGYNVNSIYLRNYDGEQPHIAPDGEEGYKYTVEEVYALLSGLNGLDSKNMDEKSNDYNKSNKDSHENLTENENGNEYKSKVGSGNGNVHDDEDESGIGDGYGYGNENEDENENGGEISFSGGGSLKSSGFDDHSKLNDSQGSEEKKELQDVWTRRIIDVAETVRVRELSKGRGTIPEFANRMLENLRKPQTDWRTILNEFIQEEINDYSFSPPDRRFDDSPFFLPDFNEKDETVKNILFMIDTSGSMSDRAITDAYSEILGAIEQFGGKLMGWLGFFDAAVIEPIPFETMDEFKIIRPQGGGGTRFDIIFDYVNDKMVDNPPVSIVILTDGEAPFPDEKVTNSIPVLWIINNEEVTPPFGKIARIRD